MSSGRSEAVVKTGASRCEICACIFSLSFGFWLQLDAHVARGHEHYAMQDALAVGRKWLHRLQLVVTDFRYRFACFSAPFACDISGQPCVSRAPHTQLPRSFRAASAQLLRVFLQDLIRIHLEGWSCPLYSKVSRGEPGSRDSSHDHC